MAMEGHCPSPITWEIQTHLKSVVLKPWHCMNTTVLKAFSLVMGLCAVLTQYSRRNSRQGCQFENGRHTKGKHVPNVLPSFKQVHVCWCYMKKGSELRNEAKNGTLIGQSSKLMLVQVSAKDRPNIGCESVERRHFQQKNDVWSIKGWYFTVYAQILTLVHPTLAEG